MLNPPFVEQVISKLEQWSQANFNRSNDAFITTLSADIALLENHPLYSNLAFAILRINPLEMVYLSNTAKRKYFSDSPVKDTRDLLALIDKDYLSFIKETLGVIDYYKKTKTNEPILALKIAICGIKLWIGGIQKTVAVHVHYLTLDEKSIPTTAIVITDEISALFEAQHYWIRCEVMPPNDSKSELFCLQSNVGGAIFDHDIISARELLVLELMRDGLTTNSIAKDLSISVNTVNNHKQNMYRRTGARNSTALIELAVMCGIL